MKAITTVIVLGAALAAVGCSLKPQLRLTVGATPSTEGAILAEIAAQQLEKFLGVPVNRKIDVGSTTIGYESLLMSAIDIYPEDTNAIAVSVLKDPLDQNPDIVLERVRGEMARVGRIYVSSPLGVRRRTCMVMRAADARDSKIETVSDAARAQLAWTLGSTSEFDQRGDGYSALMSTYKLPLKVAPKPVPDGMLYSALASNQVSIIAGHDTDGLLGPGSEFVMLKDDKNAFRESQKCFLVRQETIDREPRVRAALERLAGKITNETMRRLNYEVDGQRHLLKDVAAGFLKQAGV